MSAAAEGIMTVKVDMLISDRRDCLRMTSALELVGRLILVGEPRKDGGVVINDRICGQPTALILLTDKPLINRLGTPKRFTSRFFKDQAASCALCTLVLGI